MQRYIDKFITYLKVEKNASPHTVTNYVIDLKAFGVFLGEKDIGGIDHIALRKFLAEMRARNYSKRTIARKLASLRSFFRFLYREGLIKTNPITAISTPKFDKKLPVVLDVSRIAKLIQSPPDNTLAGL
ncbi:MAG: site-specific integrase, partial [Candidatus Omnitrophica bacterium]|nr:site-specific integrase [Candidatus Omnitrophota bacterium]